MQNDNRKRNELQSIFFTILKKNDFGVEDAEILAEIFTENTLVGVSSHGVNRFAGFIELVNSGHIKTKVKPKN